jgi:hypothetical protein
MVAEARAVRQRMLDDAERRRAAVRADLLHARAAIDEALAALGAAEAASTAGGAARAAPGPAPAEPVPPDTGAPPTGDDASDVFAKLRAAPAPPAPATPPKAKAARKATPEREAADEREPGEDGSEAAPEPEAEPAPPPSADDSVRSRRDAVLTPLLPDLLRASKRLLQDEQNVLLDAVRRARTKVEPSRLLPEPVHHRDAWAAVLAPATDVAYASGRTAVGRRRKPANAPTRVLNELAASLVAPLRERLTVTIDSVVAEGPYPVPAELHRALAAAISARYREWRSSDLEVHLGDVLAAAYARGAYEASPSGARLRWVPERAGQCPDCDDDALEHAMKGQPFPTGQTHPPAHPGCRCVAVPDGSVATANL